MKIYLIRDTDRYKIGFSKEPKKRLKQLQTGSSEVMELVYEVECDNVSKVESSLHRYYDSKRKNGEWFALEYDDVKGFVELVKKVDSNLRMIKESSTLRKPF